MRYQGVSVLLIPNVEFIDWRCKNLKYPSRISNLLRLYSYRLIFKTIVHWHHTRQIVEIFTVLYSIKIYNVQYTDSQKQKETNVYV